MIEELTVKEAAAIIGITVDGVHKAIQRESLAARRIGPERRGFWLIERAEVERYRDERHPARPASGQQEDSDVH